MKKMKDFLALLMAGLMLASCGKPPTDFEGVNCDVNPSVLEVHNGKVEGTVKISFPDGYIHPKAVAEIVLQIANGDNAVELTTMNIQGVKFEGNNTVIPEEGGAVSGEFSVDYEDWMKFSEVQVKATATCGKKTGEVPPMKVADGVIATSTLVNTNCVAPALGADAYQQIVPEVKTAAINYSIQSSAIRSSETSKEEVATMKDYLKSVSANERQEFTGVEVSSYASPDGAEDLNTKISNNRGTASKNYVSRELSRVKVKDVEVVSNTTPEDWNGFQAAVEASDIQDKELILRVLSMYDDPEKREEEIKNISATYKELAEDILPQLRRSNIFVNVNNIGLTDDEIVAQYAADASALTVEHILYYAAMVESNDEKLAVYTKATELYPEDWRGFNDMAYIYIQEGKFNDATAALNKAVALSATPEVKNNEGAVAIATGDLGAAKEAFGAAAGAGDALNYNMGIVSMIEADYKTAANKLKGAGTNNAALAFILNKDYAGAMSELESVKEADAMTSYLMAVVAARQSKTDAVIANLKDAIAKDAAMKDAAKTDLEFAAYFENAEFKAL